MSTAPSEKVVVIAVDASVHAERAFNYYCENLYRNNHKVAVVHCIEYPRSPAGQHMASDTWEAEIANTEREMKTMDEYYKDRLRNLNINGETKFMYHAKAGEFVVHVAEEAGAAMVVVGTRGAGVLRRTILGSTSDYIVHHLHCPVLVCPPPPKGHDKSHYHDDHHHHHDEHGDHHHQQHHHHKSLFSRFLHHHHHHHDKSAPEDKDAH